ncbi:hypothetical protein V6Z11_D10G136800 [Gossypium hirsutum]
MSFNRSRSLLGRKVFRSLGRVPYRDSPYSRDRRNNRDMECKDQGYCTSRTTVSICSLQLFLVDCKGTSSNHIAVECNSTTICWNCKEPGHLAGQCPYEPVCNILPAHDARLCNNCYKAGHFVADCTNEKACNNCHKTGHLARDCHNEPVCNICNISGHVARQCAKSKLSPDIGGRFRDIFCRNCGQPGHISQDCFSIVICSNCGGRGHLHYECLSARMYDRSGVRRY